MDQIIILIKRGKKAIVSIQKSFLPSQESEHLEASNSLMAITFNDKTTAESIKIFESYRKSFESEIAKRGIDSLIENNLCDEYFRNSNQTKR